MLKDSSIENVRAKSREYYQANLEHNQARKRADYRRNREHKLAYGRAYRAKNAERIKAANKKWKDENPEKRREYVRAWMNKNRYGVTRQQHKAMLEAQNYCCAICGIDQAKLPKRLSIDHDHKSGVVRGLVCQPCNIILGLSQESTEMLRAAAAYLERHNGHGN